MDNKKQYLFKVSKEDTFSVVKQVADLEHENALARKLTGTLDEDGKFAFTLRRLSSGGAPTYSPKLIGEVHGEKRNSSIHIHFRPSITILFFGVLMSTIISVLLYKHFNWIDDDGKSLIFAIISIAILAATILTHFHLKKELKNIFLQLVLDEETKQLNNLY